MKRKTNIEIGTSQRKLFAINKGIVNLMVFHPMYDNNNKKKIFLHLKTRRKKQESAFVILSMKKPSWSHFKINKWKRKINEVDLSYIWYDTLEYSSNSI